MHFLQKLFRRKPESPAEARALENLDEATREVAWDEFDKEAAREAGDPLEPLAHEARPMPGSEPDPADDRSMREVMHEPEPDEKR